MQHENIKYVLVWSPWLRLSHGIIAFGSLFQITSAWALTHENINDKFWLDWHLIIGQIILIALVLRFILLFLPGSQNWRAFIPEKSQISAMLQMIKFYLSFSRFPLPNWYAHNPLWQPLYPVLLLVLTGCSLFGLMYHGPHRFFGYPMNELHRILANVIIIFSIAHILTVLLHDLKGKGACVSAIINGYRYFHINSQNKIDIFNDMKKKPDSKSVSISVESIKTAPKISRNKDKIDNQ